MKSQFCEVFEREIKQMSSSLVQRKLNGMAYCTIILLLNYSYLSNSSSCHPPSPSTTTTPREKVSHMLKSQQRHYAFYKVCGTC